jgi:hypothetical protein
MDTKNVEFLLGILAMEGLAIIVILLELPKIIY